MVCAYIGIGWFVSSCILKNQQRDIGWFVSIGLAAVLCIGGVLNMTGLISKNSIFTIVYIGLSSFLIFVTLSRKYVYNRISLFFSLLKNNKHLFVAIILLFSLLLVKYAASISPGVYNIHDDYQGYFVYPVKMIETGEMGSDPFSERRIVSSLGGQSFLDAIVLAVGTYENIAFTDRGIGFLIFLIAVFSFLLTLSLSSGYILVFMFVAVLTFPPIVNSTSMYTGITLFLLLSRMVYGFKDFKIREMFLFSIVLAGLFSLKSSFIPMSGLFVVVFFLLRYNTKKTLNIFIESVFIGISSVVLLIPWMLSSYHSSGTLLYPFFGKGYHGSVYGDFLSATSTITSGNFLTFIYALQTIFFLSFFSFILFILFSKSERSLLSKEDISLSLVTFISIFLLGYATGGYAVNRYTFALVFPVVLVLLARYIQANNIIYSSRRVFIGILILGLLLGSSIESFFANQKPILENIQFARQHTSLVSEKELLEFKEMQSTIPEKEKVLVRLNKNFVLNFNRNEVYIVDYPGASSLPPGMPFHKGENALAEYLISHSIYYVAYSYKDQAMFTRGQFGNRLDMTMNSWIRTEAEHTFLFQDDLEKLGKTRKRIYDNGTNFVLDLRIKI